MKEYSIDERWDICKHCSICDTDNWICNPRLFVNPNNNDVSVIKKDGYIKGCGCILSQKIKNPNKHCPAKKW